MAVWAACRVACEGKRKGEGEAFMWAERRDLVSVVEGPREVLELHFLFRQSAHVLIELWRREIVR